MVRKIAITLGTRKKVACLGEVTVPKIYEAARDLFDLPDDDFALEVMDKDFDMWVELYPEYEVQHLDVFKIQVKNSYWAIY